MNFFRRRPKAAKTGAAARHEEAKLSWRQFPPAPPSIRAVGYRRLDPKKTRLSVGALGALRCAVEGDPEVYHGVFAARLFPVRYSSAFIVLRHINPEGEREN